MIVFDLSRSLDSDVPLESRNEDYEKVFIYFILYCLVKMNYALQGIDQFVLR